MLSLNFLGSERVVFAFSKSRKKKNTKPFLRMFGLVKPDSTKELWLSEFVCDSELFISTRKENIFIGEFFLML